MSTTMLYKCPGPHDLHGGKYDYTIVPDEQIDAALADGWFLTTPEAKAAHEKAQAEAAAAVAADTKPDEDTSAPTLDELKQKATELGIPFDGRIGAKRLAAMIETKLKEQ
jgi:hypothetical protein